MRTISYLVAFTTDDHELNADALEVNVANYLRPLGHQLTVDLDDDRIDGEWEETN